MKKRTSEDFLEDYERWTADSESPPSYHVWGILTGAAACLQRKCWMKRGHSLIFPNLYTVLIGPSGGRKADAINRVRSLLTRPGINIPMGGDSTTKEAIVRDMQECLDTVHEGSAVRPHNSIAYVGNELIVLMGEHNLEKAAFLTDLYDCPASWTYRTKSQGNILIDGVCPTILSASDLKWLPHIFTATMVEGGLFRRILFVVEYGAAKIIPDPGKIAVDRGLEGSILGTLENLKKMQGEFKFEGEAAEAYEGWYVSERKLADAGKHPMQASFISGYVYGKPTTLMKVCIILSALGGNSRRISLENLEKAQALLGKLEENMPDVKKGLGTAKFAAEIEMVLGIIRTRGSITKAELLREKMGYIDTYNFEIIKDNLVAAKLISNHTDSKTRDTTLTALEV